MDGVSEEKSPSKPVRTVGEVADLTGVSVRTLHHYDHIGHVVPSARSRSDYRLYTDADVERLHRVLVYREVGLSLEQIATLLDDPDRDELSTLEEQRRLLNERIDRLHRMVDALGGTHGEQEQRNHSDCGRAGRDLRPRLARPGVARRGGKRWGDTDAWAQSRKRAARCRRPTCRRSGRAGRVDGRLVAAKTSGIEPGSTEANALAQRHRASITRFHDCDDEMHVNLAQMYLADERFTATYDDRAPAWPSGCTTSSWRMPRRANS